MYKISFSFILAPILICCVYSSVIAQNSTPYQVNHYNVGQEVRHSSLFSNKTSLYDGWVIDIDLDKIRNKPEISRAITNGLKSVSNNLPISLRQLPDEITSVHIYGTGKMNQTSVVLRGKFNKGFIETHIMKYIPDNFNGYKYSRGKERIFKKGKIYKNTLTKVNNKGEKEQKKIYIGHVSKDFIIIAQDIGRIRSGFYYDDNGWSFENMGVVSENVFAQFLINIRPTLYRLKKDKNTGQNLYKSVLFQETKNIYIILSELDENVILGALLTAYTEKKAKKVHQILEGILGLIPEQSINDIYQQMHKNSVNRLEGNTVRIGTSLPLSDLKSINEMLEN